MGLELRIELSESPDLIFGVCSDTFGGDIANNRADFLAIGNDMVETVKTSENSSKISWVWNKNKSSLIYGTKSNTQELC